MAQVIELEDIYTALSSSKPTLYKAIVSLIFSSSMSTSTISRLTLYDFLYACDEYFEAEEEKIFDNLLKKNPWVIIPCWKLKSEKRITFSTPESTFYIFMYLKEKRMEDLGNLNNPLFKSGDNKFLPSSKISSYVTQFNEVLGTERNYFKSKNLINTFEIVCDAHFYFDKEYKSNLIKLFEGKMSNENELFADYLKKSNEFKRDYESLIPYLTARYYNFDKEFLEYYLLFKNENINKKDVILEYYKSNLEEELQLSYDQSKLLCKFAQDLADDDSLLTNELYLDKAFKKALVKLTILNYDFTFFKFDFEDIDRDINLNGRAKIFGRLISQFKVDRYFEINREVIHHTCIDYLVDNNLYESFIPVSSMHNMLYWSNINKVILVQY